MPDLRDGESVEVNGSASRPYVLKNSGGIFSCSCPAWRNQSLPIEQRTCKHLRRFRGDVVEADRVGSSLSFKSTDWATVTKVAPSLLLAQTWDGETDPAGWWMSEKLDGIRAYWNGEQFLSRLGNTLHAPDWFTVGLPSVPLDGELWITRKAFQRTVSVVRRHDRSEHWRDVRFLVFDAPDDSVAFERRLRTIETIMQSNRPAYAQALEHRLCRGANHLRRELAQIESLGGEGLMLRQPDSLYQPGRSNTLLKVKTFITDEGVVIGHEPSRGRHRGRLGALLLELPNGKRFAVGTGLSDAERINAPPVGSTITFRYQELTDGGVPRFPSYVGIRACANRSSHVSILNQGVASMATMTKPVKSAHRRFEFTQGASDKFWEIEVTDKSVTVCYGRNGTAGQSQTKSLADASAAQKHADKLIGEKLAKGYREVVTQ